jgi:hypothetical protein
MMKSGCWFVFTSLPFLTILHSFMVIQTFSSDCMKHCSVFEFVVAKKLVPLCQWLNACYRSKNGNISMLIL